MKTYKECQETNCKNCKEENCVCKNQIFETPSKVSIKGRRVAEEMKINKDFSTPKKTRT